MDRPYGVGVLGLGTIGRMIANELSESPRFGVVAVFDPATDNGSGYPDVDRAESVCADSGVDCVYVASPPRWHAEGVDLAIKHGKAILCEKPLAPTPEEADRLAAAVTAAGLPNVVNFGFHTLSTGRSLEHAVRQGLLGRVESAEIAVGIATWPQGWHAQAGPWLTSPDEGGFTREVVTHFLGLADQLFGKGILERADVHRGEDGLETRAAATIRYGDVQLSLDARLDPTIETDSDMNSRFTVRCERGEMAVVDWTIPVGIPFVDPRPEGIADALAVHLDGGGSGLQDFAAGARVSHLIEGILASNGAHQGS